MEAMEPHPLKWFVLWVYLFTPFVWMGVPLGPGWYSAASFPPPTAEADCNMGRREEKVDVCLPAGVIPGIVAQIRR